MPPRATFRDVFAVREFRALWFSEILSVAGDRLALVALTLLVYDRTRSPLLAALAYAAGYLPWVIGGLFLADVADRRPRRTVMVACDVVRAVLVAAMAVPGVPLLALVALLFATTMFTPPFESARAAITPDILQGELYVLGAGGDPDDVPGRPGGRRGRRGSGGGLRRHPPGARHRRRHVRALRLVNSVRHPGQTRRRPAGNRPVVPVGRAPARASAWCSAIRRCAPCCCSAGWWPSTRSPRGSPPRMRARLGGGPIATGLVLASTVFATTIVTPLFTRFIRARQRLALMGPLAVLTCATLVLTALHPGLVVSLVIFSLSAVFGIYQIAANTAFVVRVPNERRSQAFGLANMGVVVGQGAAFVAAGAAAVVISPAAVIAISGAIGAVIAIVLTLRWRHVSPPGGRHAARRRPGRAATRKSVPLRGSS